MPFYIELPADEYGNSALPPAVFEGEILQGGTPGTGAFSNPRRQVFIISAPDCRHSGLYTDSYGGFAETEGPARTLTSEEWRALVTATTGYDFNR